jgi:hypothetical protein
MAAQTCGPRELLGGLPALASVNETKEQHVGTSQSLKKVKRTLNRKTRAAHVQGAKEAAPELQRIKHQVPRTRAYVPENKRGSA